jgi:hypothetical protein
MVYLCSMVVFYPIVEGYYPVFSLSQGLCHIVAGWMTQDLVVMVRPTTRYGFFRGSRGFGTPSAIDRGQIGRP